MLGLHAEQEGRGEVLVGEDAGGVVPGGRGGEVLWDVVAVSEGDDPPDDGEDEPGEHEAGDEGEQGVAPLPVQDRDEHVLQESRLLLVDPEELGVGHHYHHHHHHQHHYHHHYHYLGIGLTRLRDNTLPSVPFVILKLNFSLKIPMILSWELTFIDLVFGTDPSLSSVGCMSS